MQMQAYTINLQISLKNAQFLLVPLSATQILIRNSSENIVSIVGGVAGGG